MPAMERAGAVTAACGSHRYRAFRDRDGNLTLTYWYLLAVRLGFLIMCQVTATGPHQEGWGRGSGWGCADPVSPLAASTWFYQACGHLPGAQRFQVDRGQGETLLGFVLSSPRGSTHCTRPGSAQPSRSCSGSQPTSRNNIRDTLSCFRFYFRIYKIPVSSILMSLFTCLHIVSKFQS